MLAKHARSLLAKALFGVEVAEAEVIDDVVEDCSTFIFRTLRIRDSGLLYAVKCAS